MMALPETAQAKLTSLRLQFADAIALADAGAKSVMSLREQQNHLRSSLSRLESGGAENAELIAEAKRDLAAVESEITRVSGLVGARRARVQATGDLIRAVDKFLNRNGGVTFAPVAVSAAPADGETLAGAIARVRGELDDLAGELTRVRRSPHLANEIKAAMRTRIDAMARAGQPKIYDLSAETPRLDLFPSTLSGDTLGRMFNREVMENALAWLHGDAIKAALDAEIDRLVGEDGVSSEARTRAETELPTAILAMERAEEALIERAITEGVEVGRRPNASPLAVLGIGFADDMTEVMAA